MHQVRKKNEIMHLIQWQKWAIALAQFKLIFYLKLELKIKFILSCKKFELDWYVYIRYFTQMTQKNILFT